MTIEARAERGRGRFDRDQASMLMTVIRLADGSPRSDIAMLGLCLLSS
jgi:hypothetical protein